MRQRAIRAVSSSLAGLMAGLAGVRAYESAGPVALVWLVVAVSMAGVAVLLVAALWREVR